MNHPLILDLADCSDFRQTVAARPPRVVHGTALLLVTLVAAGVGWLVITDANIVVRARGRVRSLEKPTRVYVEHADQRDGRVEEVLAQQGDRVEAGQVLLRLDTRRLDNEIARIESSLSAARSELAELERVEKLTASRYQAARAKATAEVVQAKADLARAAERRASEIRAARVAFEAAKSRLQRDEKLVASSAVSQERIERLRSELAQAGERLKQAALPLDQEKVDVLRKALHVIDEDFAVAQAENRTKRIVRQGERDASEKQLANLRLARGKAEVRSPIDGVIVSGQVKEGDVLAPGRAVWEIARADEFRFEATVPNEEVAKLRVGMPVRIKFDAYDFQTYGTLPGVVSFLSPDSRTDSPAELGQSRSESTQTNAKVVYSVRVDLPESQFGREDRVAKLKLGLAGAAEIVTERQSLWTILVKKIKGSVSLG